MTDGLTRADLRDLADDILDRVGERFDSMQLRGDERHRDNVGRMDEMVRLQRITNGRVTALETINSTANNWPSLKVWIGIVVGVVTACWFVLTQVMGFHRP